MNIAVFIGYMGSGGAEIVAIKSANTLARLQGNNVVFIYLPKDDNFYLDEIDNSVQVVALRSPSLLRSIREIRRLCVELEIDMLISHMTDENIIISLACWGMTVRHIGYEHNHVAEIEQKGRFRWLITKQLMRVLYPRMETLIVVSNGLKTLFSEFMEANKIVALYNPCVTQSHSTPARWSKKMGSLHIAFVGRNVYQKDFSYAKDLFLFLQNQLPELDMKLNVYGTGYEQESDTNAIEFHGHKDRRSIYRDNNMLLMTSRYEGFGNVVIEAVQDGCFPVVKRVDYGPTEIVSHTYGCVFDKKEDLISLLKKGWDVKEVNLELFNEDYFENEFKKIIC